MSQTLTFPTWYLSGSGWSIRYSGSVTISVSRSYGSDTATVTASGWMNTPNTDGDSNASWKFWIKIGSATYTNTFTSGYHAPGTTKYFSYSWNISVGANSGTLSGQAALQAYDNNNSFGAWSDTKDWSQAYGSKGASTIASASNVTLNTAGTATSTVTFTSYSSSFTHKIKATLGSVSTSEITVSGGNNVSKSGTLTFGTAFINAINTAKTGTATVYLYTYSGSTLVGSNTKTITLTVPSGINPTASILSVTKVAVTQNPFTAICSSLDAARVTWDFGASYGSALNSGTVTVDGIAGSNTDGYYTSGTLRNSGMRTASVSATDKRGNTGSDSETFPVYEYFYPSVTVKYKRSGSAHKLTLEGKFASVGGENNTRILKLDVYKNGSKINQADISLTSFISAVTGSDTPYNDYYAISGDYTIPITDIDGHGTDISDITTETYTFKVTAQDRIAASTAEDSSGISVMTFTKGGTGVQVHKPIDAEEGLKIGGVTVADFPVEMGAEAASGNAGPCTWRKWNSGFCELHYGSMGVDIPANSANASFSFNFPFSLTSVKSFSFGLYHNASSAGNAGIFDVSGINGSTGAYTGLTVKEHRNSATADNWAVSPRTCIDIYGFWK